MKPGARLLEEPCTLIVAFLVRGFAKKNPFMIHESIHVPILYRDGPKREPVLLSNSQAGPDGKVLQPRDHFLAHLCTDLQVSEN